MINTNKLKGKIVERGLNIESLAKEMDIDKATLYRKISNSEKFSIKELDLIVSVLRLSPEEAMAIFFSQFVA